MSVNGRAPRGARGLKCLWVFASDLAIRRAPRGARGLKYIMDGWQTWAMRSRPARGAWIEIYSCRHSGGIGRRAPRGARLFPERPLLVGDDFVLIGFKEAEWERLLKTQ